jgi:hypothetical protein
MNPVWTLYYHAVEPLSVRGKGALWVSSPPRGRCADHDEDLGRRAMGHRHARRLVADRSSPSFSSRAQHRRLGHGCRGRHTHPEIRRGGIRSMPPASYMRSREVVIDAGERLHASPRNTSPSLPRESRTCPWESTTRSSSSGARPWSFMGAAGGALRSTRARCCRAGFAFFPSRSSFSDKRLHGDQRPARQSPKLHP